MGETLEPAVGAEGHVELQGQLCCTFCHLGRHYRDFWRYKHGLLHAMGIFNVFSIIIKVPSKGGGYFTKL